jgi:hypothetical protein
MVPWGNAGGAVSMNEVNGSMEMEQLIKDLPGKVQGYKTYGILGAAGFVCALESASAITSITAGNFYVALTIVGLTTFVAKVNRFMAEPKG